MRLTDPPVTGRGWTALAIAAEPDRIEAVAALDLLFRERKPRRDVLDPWVAKFPDSAAARAIALADPRAESPQESRARVRITLAGFPPPVPQHEVRWNGRFVARVDLAWPDEKVAVEYDGLWHGETGQFFRDRARLDKLSDAGWRVYHLTAIDLGDEARFEAFCARLRRALAA